MARRKAAKAKATITARRPVIRGGKRVGYVIAYSDGTFRGALTKGSGALTKSKAFRRESQARAWLLGKVPTRGKAGRPRAARRRNAAMEGDTYTYLTNMWQLAQSKGGRYSTSLGGVPVTVLTFPAVGVGETVYVIGKKRFRSHDAAAAALAKRLGVPYVSTIPSKRRNPPGNASQAYAAPWAKVRKVAGGYTAYGVDRNGTKVSVRVKSKAKAQGIAEAVAAGALATGGAKALGQVTRVQRRRNPSRMLSRLPVAAEYKWGPVTIVIHKSNSPDSKYASVVVSATGSELPGSSGNTITEALSKTVKLMKGAGATTKGKPVRVRKANKGRKAPARRRRNQGAKQIDEAVAYARKVWNLEIGRAKREGRYPDQGRIYSLVEKRYPTFDVKLLRSIAFDTRPARKANKRRRNYRVPPMTRARYERSWGDDPTEAEVGDRVVIDPTGGSKLYLTVTAAKSGCLELVNKKGSKYGLTIYPAGPGGLAGMSLRTPSGKRRDVSPYHFHFTATAKANPKRRPNKTTAKAKKLTKAAMAKVTTAFKRIQAKARQAEPELNFVKLVARPGIHDSPRHFAETNGKVIYVAPELASEAQSVIRGVLMHEFGHAYRMLTGKIKKDAYDAEERAADKAAERIFGTQIYYDKRGVETTVARGNKRPRPAGLR